LTMAEIKPFWGVRYSTSLFEDLGSVLAPPYDVIDQEAELHLRKKSKYNVVNLILPQDRKQPGDRYQNAADLFQRWQESGILTRDPEPSVYILEQEFTLPGRGKVVRQGIICLLKLEDFDRGVVLPHEKTLSAPKEDRLRLLQACRANLSQVFGFYSDETGAIRQLLGQDSEPLFETSSREGVIRFSALKDEARLCQLQELFSHKKIYIADGHHRYETALAYARRVRNGQEPTGDLPSDYVCVFLVAMEDEGLVILPTHRLVKKSPKIPGPARLLNKLSTHFAREELPLPEDRVDEKVSRFFDPSHPCFLLYAGNKVIQRLTLRETAQGALERISPALRTLDVVLLQELVLTPLLQIDQESIKAGALSYTHTAREAVNWVRKGHGPYAFILRPTPIEHVVSVAEDGSTMPQKSTYFYPKIPSGLVFYRMDR